MSKIYEFVAPSSDVESRIAVRLGDETPFNGVVVEYHLESITALEEQNDDCRIQFSYDIIEECDFKVERLLQCEKFLDLIGGVLRHFIMLGVMEAESRNTE